MILSINHGEDIPGAVIQGDCPISYTAKRSRFNATADLSTCAIVVPEIAIDGAGLAPVLGDVMAFTAWHAQVVFPRLESFAGYDAVYPLVFTNSEWEWLGDGPPKLTTPLIPRLRTDTLDLLRKTVNRLRTTDAWQQDRRICFLTEFFNDHHGVGRKSDEHSDTEILGFASTHFNQTDVDWLRKDMRLHVFYAWVRMEIGGVALDNHGVEVYANGIRASVPLYNSLKRAGRWREQCYALSRMLGVSFKEAEHYRQHPEDLPSI